jgi:hypothetical protein
MNTSPLPGTRHHPLLILAALAVMLFCLVGTAAIMGWMPSSIGGNAARQLSEADRAALASSLTQPPGRRAAGAGQPAWPSAQHGPMPAARRPAGAALAGPQVPAATRAKPGRRAWRTAPWR